MSEAVLSLGLGAAMGVGNLVLARAGYRRALRGDVRHAVRLAGGGFLARLLGVGCAVLLLGRLPWFRTDLFLMAFLTLFLASTVLEAARYLRTPPGRPRAGREDRP